MFFWRFVAGLLDTDHSEEQLQRFFRAIEDQPRDLFGPVHQRLAIHYLSEVVLSPENPEFERLQEQLKEWLLFECTWRGRSQLSAEMEFPNEILKAILRISSKILRGKLSRIRTTNSMSNLLSSAAQRI